MQYGYFDLKNKEYVIDHPDTPHRGSTTLVRRNTAQSFPTMLPAIASSSPAQTAESAAIASTR